MDYKTNIISDHKNKHPFNYSLPNHWSLHRFKDHFKEVTIKNQTSKELLSVYLNKGVIKYSDSTGMQVHKPSESLEDYQLVKPGNFVMNNQQAWRGSVGVSMYEGIISPAYLVFEMSNNLNNEYANFLLRDDFMISQFLIASKGVGSIQRNIYTPNLLNVYVAIPPIDEQIDIANILNYKVNLIDTYILEKSKIMSLLNEQKLSIIDKLVTQGVDENIEKIATNIPWFPYRPLHWKIKRNKNVFHLKKIIVGEESVNHDVLSLSINGIIPRDIDSGKGKFPGSFDGYQIVRKNDFVFCLFDLDETPRTVGLSNIDGIISSAYTVFETSDVDREYLYYYYLTLDNRKALKPLYTGLRKVINNDVFLRAQLVCPPIEEQRIIVKEITKSVSEIDVTIEHIQKEITLLEEFKSTLIHNYVTGKVQRMK